MISACLLDLQIATTIWRSPSISSLVKSSTTILPLNLIVKLFDGLFPLNAPYTQARRFCEDLSNRWVALSGSTSHITTYQDVSMGGYKAISSCFIPCEQFPWFDELFLMKKEKVPSPILYVVGALDECSEVLGELSRFFLLLLLHFQPWGILHKRPRHVTCATMPWSILPSLVILWGVCWMFHVPWTPFSSDTNLEETADGVVHSTNEFLAVPSFEFYTEVNFDLLPGEFSVEYNDLNQVQSATFQTSYTITGDAGVLVHEISGATPSDHQQHNWESPSSLSGSAVIENRPAASEALPHADQSNISIHCTEPACDSRFKTERELHRHKKSIHSDSQFACAVAGCKRGSKKPFNRHDNLQRHMQRVHGQAGQAHAVSVADSVPRGQKRQASTISNSAFVPENRRRRLEDALVHADDAHGSSEPAIDQSAELARLRRELEDAVADNESLKEEIKLLKEEIKLRNALDECVRNRLARE